MISEAIEILKTYTDGKDNTDKVEISVMQLNRIIKALDQQPTDAVDRVTIKEYLESFGKVKTELSGVAVDRQAVLDVISELNAISFYEAQEDSKECYYEIRNAIKQLPPVTPQPMSGYISIEDAMSAFDDFMCNDIEPEGQEVFLELLKDRAERSKE